MKQREALLDWQSFLLAEGHVLRRNPALLFQQAANEPDSAAPARGARARSEAGLETRPWIRYVNKPQSSSGCLMTLAGHTSRVTACAFSPDGKRLLSASADGTLKIWDVAAGRELLTLAGHKGAVSDCGFTPNGQRIVSASSDGTLKIWDANTGHELATLLGHRSEVNCCAISPDGAWVVSGADSYWNPVLKKWDDAHFVKLWDLAHGALMFDLRGHQNAVYDCVFSPDGRFVLTASYDETLILWEIATATVRTTFPWSYNHPTCCAFSPDGRSFVAGCKGGSYFGAVKLWDVMGGRESGTLISSWAPVTGCAFSPDGTRIAAGSDDNTLKLWDAETGQEIAALVGHSQNVLDCAFSPDGTKIASASADGTVRLWEAQIQIEKPRTAKLKRCVNVCEFSPDGSRLLVGSGEKPFSGPQLDMCEGELVVLDAGEGAETARLLERDYWWFTAGQFTPEGRRVLACRSHSVRMLDIATGEETGSVEMKADTLALSPDGLCLVTGCWEAEVILWDLAAATKLATLAGHAGEINACAFSPDGRLAASASSDKTVKLWDVGARQEYATLGPGEAEATTCCFSPDGRCVAAGYSNSLLKLWDPGTGRELATLRTPADRHRDPHTFAMHKCAFSPDGALLAACFGQTRAHVWDVASRKVIAEYWCEHFVRAVAWRPGSQLLAVGDSGGGVHLLRLEKVKSRPPVLTARRDSHDGALAAGCPTCRAWSKLPESALGKEWPCPNCGKESILNPFAVNADWRPIAEAWSKMAANE